MREPKGYSIDKRRKSRPYKVQIRVGKEYVYIDHFDTPEEARAAYLAARAKYPRLPRTGGNPNWERPRKICLNCQYDWSEPDFNKHYNYCIRKWPEGRPFEEDE
jgi:hypothetical protein